MLYHRCHIKTYIKEPGCCYGRPYNGPLAVRFPAGSYAPHGVSLFPLQLLESILLFIAAAIFYRKYSVPENERDDSLLSYLMMWVSKV